MWIQRKVSWIQDIISSLKVGMFLKNKKEARKLHVRITRYILQNDILIKRVYTVSLDE